MANMIQNAKDSINALLNDACAKAAAKGQLPEGASLSGTVEIPKDTQNGDYAANHAMTGARALHMAPRKIAEALVENMIPIIIFLFSFISFTLIILLIDSSKFKFIIH